MIDFFCFFVVDIIHDEPSHAQGRFDFDFSTDFIFSDFFRTQIKIWLFNIWLSFSQFF